MAKPRLRFTTGQSTGFAKAATVSDYRIGPTYQRTPSADYFGVLKVVRLADRKLLFSFDGAAKIGPLSTALAAGEAARITGANVVLAAIRRPSRVGSRAREALATRPMVSLRAHVIFQER
jgi:hypothetical protein